MPTEKGSSTETGVRILNVHLEFSKVGERATSQSFSSWGFYIFLVECTPAKVARSECVRTLYISRGLYSLRHLFALLLWGNKKL